MLFPIDYIKYLRVQYDKKKYYLYYENIYFFCKIKSFNTVTYRTYYIALP